MKFIRYFLIFTIICITSCIYENHSDFYSNNILKEEYSKRNGKLHGLYKSFYENGSFRSKGKYYKGKMDGEWDYWYPNGKKQSVQLFNKGQLRNLDFWDINGFICIKNGKGTAMLYYPNGKKLSRSTYKNCKLDGKYITWYESGRLESINYYKDGKLMNKGFRWDINGFFK
jgi:uncharacterized protein